MSAFLVHFRTAWNDYYSTTNPTNYNSKTYTSRQTPVDTSVYISNCLFNGFTSTSGNGGALFCSTAVTYLLIESSSFFSCNTTSQYSGAIYFSNNNGQSVLHKVCGNDCCSTYGYNPHCQFAMITVNNAATSKNYVNYSSIARCVSEESRPHYVLRLGSGMICCPSVNMSMNKCYGRSAIHCYPFSDSNNFTCSLTYSSFTDNIATGYICFDLTTGGANYEIKSCNILRNSQVSGSNGIIYISGNLKIEDSCILENNANCIFYQSSSYTITVSKCTVDSTSNNGYLTTQNTVTKSFILALNHMSTRNCRAEYDEVGMLTPIIHTPSPSNKQKNCCTGDRFFLHLQLRDFFSLISILLFNFIYPYAFSDHLY
jgi:hypothetical protein